MNEHPIDETPAGQPHPGPVSSQFLALAGRLFLFVFGWKAEGVVPPYSRAVFIAAPHTSNWDGLFMLACSWVLRIRISWMGKHTLFKGVLGWWVRFSGGVPVDRRSRNNAVKQMADYIRSVDRIYLAISPEGMRIHSDYWKSGFYHIAREANIPIVCAYLDYGRKAGGVGPIIWPSGDVRADMEKIRAFYTPIQGKFPSQKGMIRLREEDATQTPPAAPAQPRVVGAHG